MIKTQSKIGTINDFPLNLGQCVKLNDQQVAIFYIPTSTQQWFAVDNLNPQNQRMVLSRGIVGEMDGIPYVACPLHKDKYSLIDGICLTDQAHSIATYNLTIEGDHVFLEL